MGKILNIDTFQLYKKALKKLRENNIDFDKNKLLNDPELCLEIIKITEYYEKESQKEEKADSDSEDFT